MRLDLGGRHFVLFWTEDQYRNEIARLMQGITTTTVRLLWTRRLFGLRLVVLRRIEAKPQAPAAGDPG
jgi:hypothetical protein